jgi:ketosteroid isomerase-like protein
MAGGLGRSITGEFIRSKPRLTSLNTILFGNYSNGSGVHLENYTPEDRSMSTRHIISLVLTVCAAATLNSAQQSATSIGKPEDQVTQLERDWLTADGKGDVASLRRIISDDFMGSSFDGQMLSKQDIIPERTGPGGFAGATLGDTNVRVFGDTAVLMGVINTAGAPPKQIHVTLVVQKKPQGWQMIAAQLTRTQ